MADCQRGAREREREALRREHGREKLGEVNVDSWGSPALVFMCCDGREEKWGAVDGEQTVTVLQDKRLKWISQKRTSLINYTNICQLKGHLTMPFVQLSNRTYTESLTSTTTVCVSSHKPEDGLWFHKGSTSSEHLSSYVTTDQPQLFCSWWNTVKKKSQWEPDSLQK